MTPRKKCIVCRFQWFQPIWDLRTLKVLLRVPRTAISKARILRISVLALAEHDDLACPADVEQRALVVRAYSRQVKHKSRVELTLHVSNST